MGLPYSISVVRYSTRIAANLVLQAELHRRGWVLNRVYANAGRETVKLDRGGVTVEGAGETFELALCRAALRAGSAGAGLDDGTP